MDFIVPNELTYQMDGRLSVTETAKAIVAQERLVREAISVIEVLYPGLELQKINVGVRYVVQESPYRSILLAFIAGVYSGEIGADMPDLIETITGGAVDVPDNWDSLVSLIVLAIVIIMGDKVRAKYWPDASEQILAREKDRVLASAEAVSGVAAPDIQSAIDKKTSQHPSLIANSAMEIVGPAKRHHANAIGVGYEEMGRDVIEAIPSDADMAMLEPSARVEELENTLVEFEAHDLRRPKRWAAVVPEAFPQRLPLHLAPHINPTDLFQKRQVVGDVVVSLIRNSEGSYDPSYYVLTRVQDDQPS